MKISRSPAALAAVGTLFISLAAPARASAAPSDAADDAEEAAPPAAAAPATDEPAKVAPSATPAQQSEEPKTDAPYVGFAPPPAPLQFENANASIRFGLLAQPQFEMVGAQDADSTTKNLFLRRIRFMVGGTLFKSFEYFFDTDYPDLFKSDPGNQSGGTGKNAPGMNVQDAFVTFKPLENLLKVDAGYMLPPLSHNGVQGAATLFGSDYFVNTFRRNISSNIDPFGSSGQSPVGRDAGVQLRGLVLNDHVEYRVGVFQGTRQGPLPANGGANAVVGGNNFFRMAARVQVNILDAEPGFFYQGTYLGAKNILSVGAFYDFEDHYKYAGADAFLELPAGPGTVNAQVNYVQWDGGSFIGNDKLPKAKAFMAQAGYLINPIMLSPILSAEKLTAANPTIVSPSETRYGGGVAFWPYGHNVNLKAFFTKVHRDPALHDFNQINVQWQLYFY